MNQYEVTAKLWVKVTVDTLEDAEGVVKTIVDEAMYDYIQYHKQIPVSLSISKSKVIWAKDISPKEGK